MLEDGFIDPPRLLAGLDVGFEDDGTLTRAAGVLLEADTLRPIASEVVRRPTSFPYVPGLLSFRELPALLQVLAYLPEQPDLVFVDGQGIAHPRRLGIAAHLGVVTGLPTIGVAKKPLCGRCVPPGPEPGARSPLQHQGEKIAWVMRSKARCNPLFVSPGHRVTMDTAADWVMRTLGGYRLPEPTRLADHLASRREEKRAAATSRPLF